MIVASAYDSKYQTPLWACELMIDLIPAGSKTILEPTPGEGRLVKRLLQRGYKDVTAPDLFSDIDPFSRFDAVVMNPPYKNSIEYVFLFEALKMSDNVIALMPWFCVNNSDSRTEALLDFGFREAISLPRATFPYIRVNVGIFHFQRGWSGSTNFRVIRKSEIKGLN